MSYNNNNYNNNKNNGGKAGALADYITVNERIIEFYKKYPEGRITTDIVSWENGVIIMKATVYRNFEDAKELAVGHAYEKEDASFINKTSALENCETSAVGRALALAGFEIKKSIASREEVANAIHQQQVEEDKRKPTEAQFKRFYAMLKEAYMRESDILSFYNKRTKKNITKETMSLADYDKITQYLQKEIDAKLQGGK